MAFLLVLERLTPKERAAYLLHEVFDQTYPEIASILELKESACRKLVSRARISLEKERVRSAVPLDDQRHFLVAFRAAINDGAIDLLSDLLARDVRLNADGGGKVPAVGHTLEGKQQVLPFVATGLGTYWAGMDWDVLNINKSLGVILRDNGKVVATVSFAFDDERRVTDIFIVRNPDKLARLDPIVVH